MPLSVSSHANSQGQQVAEAVGQSKDNASSQFCVENPSLDLETYSTSCTGLSRLYRLIYVADVCPSLRVEALKMALKYVKETYNISMYQLLHRKLSNVFKQPTDNTDVSNLISSSSSIASLYVSGKNNSSVVSSENNLPDVANQQSKEAVNTIQNADLPEFDTAWVEATIKKSAQALEKLTSDLKIFKVNSIKESIRRGHDDLGDHYVLCGDLSSALKFYSRARDYCTSGAHVVNMCWNVIKVSIYLQNWSHVLSYVSKAENIPDNTGCNKDALQGISTRLRCVSGLAEMQLRKYRSAARHFLSTNFEKLDFPDIISQSNVAIYCGLCALATFERVDLQRYLISSTSFKLFLELEPQLRDILSNFYDSKYASCLQHLEEIRDNLYLDMYIAPHVTDLYTRIRNRLVVQYFSPYVSADMRKMADEFDRTVDEMEDEIIILIQEGQIKGRIDSHNKVLHAKESNPRRLIYQRTLLMGRAYQKRYRMLILRAAMLRRCIHVTVAPSR